MLNAQPIFSRRRISLLIAGIIALIGVTSCSPFFILRAGYEEAKILTRRESISELVADPETAPETRSKLALVLEVRDFAEHDLGLEAGESYTTFSQLDSDTLALVMSAAEKDRFVPHTWWFPIVGRVPYRAFFSESSASRAVANMEEDGFDAYVRPTSAFSTLGWFNDPMVSPLLRYDSLSLTNTVVHELTHNTIYIPGQATFNESLATFVGARGAIDFYCGRGDDRLCERARAAWRDELEFGRFLSELVTDLEALYARTDLTYEQKLQQREGIFSEAMSRFADEVQPGFEVLTFASFARGPVNNAFLIARRIYYQELDLFERAYQVFGRDLPETIREIAESAEAAEGDPYEAVHALLLSTRPR